MLTVLAGASVMPRPRYQRPASDAGILTDHWSSAVLSAWIVTGAMPFSEMPSVTETACAFSGHLVDLELLGRHRQSGQQTVGDQGFVLNRKISAGDFGTARRGAAPCLCDDDVRRSGVLRGRRHQQERSEQDHKEQHDTCSEKKPHRSIVVFRCAVRSAFAAGSKAGLVRKTRTHFAR